MNTIAKAASLLMGMVLVAGAVKAAPATSRIANERGATAQNAVAPRVITLGELPLLFADDGGISSKSGLVRTLHPARTLGHPVLKSERPWEGDRVYVYGSVMHDGPTNQLRMWYMSRSEMERGDGKERAPGLVKGHFDIVLYATSGDGLHWARPALGIHEYDKSRDNNIVFDLHSPSVLLDRFEKDPARRYKMIGAQSGNYHAAYSPDGLHWSRYPRNPVLTASDTITLAQDPATGEYLAYHKRPATVRGYGRRVVWLARSRDFQEWTKPELVLAPDKADDEWTTRPGQRTEIYNMSVYPHAGGFIGLPTIFRLMRTIPRAELTPGQSPADGPIDVQLATSLDGRTWTRSEPRQNMIPRGPAGAFDAGAILGVTSTMVHVGEETWVYYTGLTTTHGGPMPPKRLSIGRAQWRRHGFVSLDSGEETGRIETQPLKLTNSSLIINADAGRGELRAGLLEADGKPIRGMGVEDCEPLRADATRWLARWRGGMAAPTDRPVRVVIEMRNSRLFSLSVASQ